MHVLVATDSFGGTLSAAEAAVAIASGWSRVRPDDDVVTKPLSDGGEGLLDVLAGSDDRQVEREVVGPLGLPLEAPILLRDDGSAVIESARACGLALVHPERRNPLQTTTYGVGQLMAHARAEGAHRILVGLGGSATVDGGTGALLALGFRLTVADGSGLKVGGADLRRVAAAAPTWVDEAWADVDVRLLADVRTPLLEAPRTFGPQKGADEATIEVLEDGLLTWATVAERDLDAPGLRDRPGTGAAGGLGFGLAAGLGAELSDGAWTVAELLDVDRALADADVVLTGEGRLDATSFDGKVVGEVAARAAAAGVPALAVVGQRAGGAGDGLDRVAVAAPQGPSESAEAEVAAAAASLARSM